MSEKQSKFHGGLLIFFFLVGIIATLWIVIRNGWWLPELASEHGAVIDRIFITILVISGILFILSEFALSFFVFKYAGSSERKAFYLPGNTRKEILWSIIPGTLVVVLLEVSAEFLGGASLWGKLHGEVPKDAFLVEITGEQFAWNLRYPGPDGKFGRTDPKLISPDNPLGIDISDENAEDDIVFPAGQGIMYLPLDKPVVMLIRSKDVLHSPFLPNFRVKQDAVPGMTTRAWFVPKKAGEYELACAELCGLGHYRMKLPVIVAPEEEVKEWLSQQTPAVDLYY
ncbi:cytochrome c oxidase subunit 2 [Candidatus Thermokryptus mobilis]|uniref:cytochrome-c oxidase n=1 Tax=Candidatus Thermokryptus mobilis TaxID=1643428 RepID=A0A0S4N173_9BACT|nr:cytochrome c oxidase subunit II [Candidatus Thermokryptus mobilis]CUU04873.1 cytochrome c oxidase subunit 2 [Candidatus Thermokryptus mobilis]